MGGFSCEYMASFQRSQGAFLAAGLNGTAIAATPMSDTLGVNDLTHEGNSWLAEGYGPPPVVNAPPPIVTTSQALNAPAANWKAGPVTLSMVGFTEFAAIWRQRDQGADVSSTFELNYPNSGLYYTGEVRESARQGAASAFWHRRHSTVPTRSKATSRWTS